jgi:hypothetical protein
MTAASGSCHCRAVTYEVDLDADQPTLRCNCSICEKTRNWIAPVAADAFTLLTGADDLSEYRFGSRTTTHYFCAVCGVRTHGVISAEEAGHEVVAVCVSTLELSDQRKLAFQVQYVDGRNDDYERPPEYTGAL